MTTLKVDILDPKAEKLLKNLEELKLISIRKSSQTEFFEVLRQLRSKNKRTPSFANITKEVEAVRSKRYGSK